MKNLIIVFLMLSGISYAQDRTYITGEICGGTGAFTAPTSSIPYSGGRWKPIRSDLPGAPQNFDYFPVLVVFVQFAGINPNEGINEGWRGGMPPDYLNNVIARDRDPNSNWWDAYNDYLFSDYWMENSRGKLHILGEAFNIVLDYDSNWYKNNYGNMALRTSIINEHIYQKLQTLISGTEWEFYDVWKYNSDGNFSWEKDGKIDMIYKIFRNDESNLTSPPDVYGIASLGGAGINQNLNYLIYQSGSYNLYIDGQYPIDGSGLTVKGKHGVLTKEGYLDVIAHEVGHYLFSDQHLSHTKMGGRGWEYSFSPWDMIKLGIIQPKLVNYTNPLHYLNDYFSRGNVHGTQGEILQIPIDQSNDEYFFIANRRHESVYDFTMYGDTMAGIPLKNVNPEYSKGIYIYHKRNGFQLPATFDETSHDLECADGLWNWDYSGYSKNIFNDIQYAYKRTTPQYLNDDNATYNINKDDISFRIRIGSIEKAGWFSQGKTESSTNLLQGSIDRLFTNDEDYWYSLATNGDRYDAWNVGYNEVFSPWSSPNTKKFNDTHSDIYIWYKSQNATSNTAELEIYRVNENGETEATILEKTPPSKPMIIKIEEHWNGTTCNPKIIWRQNSEPDMISSGISEITYKKYKIYQSVGSTMAASPPDKMANPEDVYQHIATVDANPSTQDTYYIDGSVNMYYCSQIPGEPIASPYPVRYRVQAVDKYSDHSVLSDFRQTIGTSSGNADGPDMIPGNESATSFNLYQNYPNPFNPVTNIRYDIQNDGFISLKIYDISGREVNTLVSGFRKNGSYIVSFNGSELSSGVYFYKMETENYRNVKRMILLK